MDYSVYDTADFICDDSFVAWVKHGEQSDFWKTVEEQYPEKKEVMQQAKAIIIAAGSLPAFKLKEGVNTQIWDNIRETMQPVPKQRFIRWYWMAAAVVTIIAIVTLLPQQNGKKNIVYKQLLKQVKSEHPVEIVNEGTKPLAVNLPDGSSVLLQPEARLSYPACFGRSCDRRVYLSGAAFFEIYRNAKKPFVVYANEMIINVLGTSFGVKAYEQDSLVKLVVKSGKVAVSVQSFNNQVLPDQQQMIITANQQAVLQRSTLLVDITSLPVYKPGPVVRVETNLFVFTDTPVDSVINTIEAAYGVHISYDKVLLADCRLTASLYDEPLYEKIRLICKALEGSCVIEGNEIKISAKGCHKNVIEN